MPVLYFIEAFLTTLVEAIIGSFVYSWACGEIAMENESFLHEMDPREVDDQIGKKFNGR